MTPSRDTQDESLKSELELAEEVLRLAAEGKLPTREEIEKAARWALRQALAERERDES